MTRNIGTDAEIDQIRLTQQIAHPSSPSAGYELLYIVSGSSHGGLFVKDSGGRQIGPFITGSPAVVGSSVLVQRKGNQTGFATGTDVAIPYDDSIPQSNEGYPFLSQEITPTSASNILYIDVTILGSPSAGDYIIMALFQNGVANALAATAFYIDTGTAIGILHLRHKMVAGTTSPITFTARAGRTGGSSFMINGRTSDGRKFGGVACSSITVDEVTP